MGMFPSLHLVNPYFGPPPLVPLNPIETFNVPSPVMTLPIPLSTRVNRLLSWQTGTTIIRTGVRRGGNIRLPLLERDTTRVLTRWAEIFYEAV